MRKSIKRTQGLSQASPLNNQPQKKDGLGELVMSRRQIEVLKARERYDKGGFGKPGSRDAERRYVNFKNYLYDKYKTASQEKMNHG